MGRLVGIGAGLPVAGDAGVDDAGVHRRHVFVAETQPRHGAGGQVFQHHVGLFRHLQEKFPSFRGTQVQRYALDALAALEEAGGDVLFR